MKAVVLSALALVLAASAAEARPAAHSVENARAVMVPLEEAATQCFAETVMSNPKATELARAGRYVEAASVIGFLCRPEVAQMMQTHDRLFGKGTGDRHFHGLYARHLDEQLAARLQPALAQPRIEAKTVASAEPQVEKASLSAKADVEAGTDLH